MHIQEFGDLLIETGDLDPVYIAMHNAQLPTPQVCRLLLAYWCFYHLGVAALLSDWEGKDFWLWMESAARNDSSPMDAGRWPRGTERRHFRGEKCVNAVQWLAAKYNEPEYPVQLLSQMKTEQQIMSWTNTWPMFGPWIGFKIADMMERVYGSKVNFDPNIGLMYDSPRSALDLLALDNSMVIVERTPKSIYNNLLTYFNARRAPPKNDRYCNCQEVETILCKFGSMRSGHYWVGKDIKEVREALHGWGPTAQRMLDVMPAEIARV